MRRYLIRVLIGFVAMVLLAIGGSYLIPCYPSVMEADSVYDGEKIAATMDPWLLVEGLATRLVIEVDWVEGCEPGPLALEGLKAILEKYGPPDRSVEILRSDEILRSEWDGAEDGSRFSRAGSIVDQYDAVHRHVNAYSPERPGLNALLRGAPRSERLARVHSRGFARSDWGRTPLNPL